MNKLIKSAALTLAAALLFSTTAFAQSKTVPVRKTFEEYGFTVSWNQENMSVILEKDGFRFEEKVGENIVLNYDTTSTTEEFVSSVYSAWMKEALSSTATVTSIEEGFFIANTEKLGEVIFKVDENTNFHHEMNRMLYRFEDLTVGSKIKVYYTEAMTASIPPQTYATEVVFLIEEVTEEVQTVTTSGKVLSVEENSFTLEKEDGNHIVFNTDENTHFHHAMNRMLYRLESLEEGMELEVKHPDMLTFSLPPQGYAIEVIIK